MSKYTSSQFSKSKFMCGLQCVRRITNSKGQGLEYHASQCSTANDKAQIYGLLLNYGPNSNKENNRSLQKQSQTSKQKLNITDWKYSTVRYLLSPATRTQQQTPDLISLSRAQGGSRTEASWSPISKPGANPQLLANTTPWGTALAQLRSLGMQEMNQQKNTLHGCRATCCSSSSKAHLK